MYNNTPPTTPTNPPHHPHITPTTVSIRGALHPMRHRVQQSRDLRGSPATRSTGLLCEEIRHFHVQARKEARGRQLVAKAS